MKNEMMAVGALLALALGARGQTLGDKGAMVAGTAEKAEAWMGTVSKKPAGGVFTSTNDWNSAAASELLAEIDARPLDQLTEKEVGFIHKCVSPGLTTPEKRIERRASVLRLAGHPDPKIATGAKTAWLSQIATKEEADALKAELAGSVAAAGAAWSAAQRLRLPDPMAYAAPSFEAVKGKGCKHPAFQKWFIEDNKKQAPAKARKALRAEIDGIMDAPGPLDEQTIAWLAELRLRRDIIAEKAAEAP